MIALEQIARAGEAVAIVVAKLRGLGIPDAIIREVLAAQVGLLADKPADG